jgi:transposase
MGNARRDITQKDQLRIVRLIEEQNRDSQLVADVFGVDRSLVYEWLRDYREGGPEALRSEGKLGRPTAISEQQVADLYLLLRNHEPREFGFGTTLWTRAIVGSLIRREFDLLLSPPTVAKIVARLGLRTGRDLSPLRGTARADVAIRAKSTQAGAKLLFGCVTHVTHGARLGGGEHDYVISAVDGRGRALFSVSPAVPDTGRLIDFGRGLLRDTSRPTFVAMRCRSDHGLAGVREFVNETSGRLRLFVLRTTDVGEDFVEF